jgi:hypothetical protein
MAHHQKSLFLFFTIFTVILLSLVGYLYYKNIYPTIGLANISWESASLQIKTNAGACLPAFPCYETYELDSDTTPGSDSDGNVLHNDAMQGRLSDSETIELIKTAFTIYQKNVCTPVYSSNENKSQSYELTIDQKVYEFGNNQGCEEMQSVINIIKEAVSV